VDVVEVFGLVVEGVAADGGGVEAEKEFGQVEAGGGEENGCGRWGD